MSKRHEYLPDPAEGARQDPPHSSEAEQGVLGCAFLSPPEVMSECEERGVKADWFYDLRHQVIWMLLAGLYAKGEPIDVMTVFQRARESNQLTEVGGLEYLAPLPDKTASAQLLDFHLTTVREKWTRRRILQIAAGMTAGARDESNDLAAGIAEMERLILGLSEETTGAAEIHIKPLVLENIDRLEDYHRGAAQITGLCTGLSYVDKMTGGLGGENGNDIVVGARPGMGKTSLGLDFTIFAALDSVWYQPHPAGDFDRIHRINSAKNPENHVNPVKDELPEGFIWAKDQSVIFEKHTGIPTAFFTLEMSALRLVRRMMFQRSLSDLQRFRTGFADGADFVKLSKAAGELSKAAIWIDPTKRLTIEMFKARVRRMFRQYGIKLFVLDYLQLMKSDRRHYKPGDRVQEMEDISGEIAALGNELNVPIISLAQLNRDSEKEPNRPPRLSDLKSAGAIEQDADVVMLLYKPHYGKGDTRGEFWDEVRAKLYGGASERDWSKAPTRVNLLIEKNRDGMTGPCELIFHKSSTHFEDYNDFLKRHGLKAPAAGEKRYGTDDLPSDEELGR